MGCISWLMKYIIFFFNLVFVLFGLASIIVGAIFKVQLDDGVYDNSDIKDFQLAPIFLIVVGCIIFVIAFLGCCGAIKKNSCMLTSYGIILIIILALQIAVAIYAFVFISNADDLKKDVFDLLKDQLEKYNSDSHVKEFIDDIQSSFECCGVDGPADWPVKPNSCCPDSKCGTPYPNGCGQDVYDYFKNNVKIVGIIACVVAAVELLAAIFAFVVAKKS